MRKLLYMITLMSFIYVIMVINIINHKWFNDCRYISLEVSGLMSLDWLNVMIC